MTPAEYIASQPEDRHQLMTALHNLILAQDTSVVPVVEPMMGAQMIIYKEQGKVMKYGLAGMKNYLSVHCLPMYMNVPLHGRFSQLLPAAKFQKGCINFTGADELPLEIVAQLFEECAKISILALLEMRKRKK